MDPSSVQAVARIISDNVERVIVGKRHEVLLVMVALLCRGHVLIEDVPGVGKTVLAKAIARSVGSTFKRIQFTPDLLPSDVTGVNVFNQQTSRFEFRPGPLMAQMVLADEINRATPKTQAALLEAMEEAQVTVDGVSHSLPSPFIVLATENPIEYEGTFPLPEAQLDRFLLRLNLGYPTEAEEEETSYVLGAGPPFSNAAEGWIAVGFDEHPDGGWANEVAMGFERNASDAKRMEDTEREFEDPDIATLERAGNVVVAWSNTPNDNEQALVDRCLS